MIVKKILVERMLKFLFRINGLLKLVMFLMKLSKNVFVSFGCMSGSEMVWNVC